MPNTSFRPVLFLLEWCPFSFKVLLYLSESKLLDRVEVKELARDSDEEKRVKERLAPHFEKVSFPTLETEPGKFINDSDAIIGSYKKKGPAPETLPAFSFYARTLLPEFIRLHKG